MDNTVTFYSPFTFLNDTDKNSNLISEMEVCTV